MARFRKKPVVIEAMRFDGFAFGKAMNIDDALALDDWLKANEGDRPCQYVGNSIVIPTLEGDMTASPGDWIVRGTAGELYPVKPGIFAEIYEPVEEV